MPTLNEAQNLPHVLPHLPADIFEVIVVDGGSIDETVEVARTLHPKVVVLHQSGAGKGNALSEGFAACGGDIILTIDADGSTNPLEIPRFIEALLQGADFAKGSRFLPEGGSDDITRLRRTGNWALTRLVNSLFLTRYTDLCYGFNAFWAPHKTCFAQGVDGFEIETSMLIRSAKAGLRVVEVPSWERSRMHGSSKLRTFRDGWRVLRTITRERFSRVQVYALLTHESPADVLFAVAAAHTGRSEVLEQELEIVTSGRD